MMKGSVIALGLISAATIFLGGAIWSDTSAYRAAQSEMDTSMAAKFAEYTNTQIKPDVDRVFACSNHDTQEFEFTDSSRSCLLDALSKTTTMFGARVGAQRASMWLFKFPGDEEVRRSALTAIAHGRAAMLATKSWGYDSFAKLAEAHDSSVFLRLCDGRSGPSNLFDKDADMLDETEYTVMMPDLARKQSEWRRESLATN
jgi:hypothetical protein